MSARPARRHFRCTLCSGTTDDDGDDCGDDDDDDDAGADRVVPETTARSRTSRSPALVSWKQPITRLSIITRTVLRSECAINSCVAVSITADYAATRVGYARCCDMALAVLKGVVKTGIELITEETLIVLRETNLSRYYPAFVIVNFVLVVVIMNLEENTEPFCFIDIS